MKRYSERAGARRLRLEDALAEIVSLCAQHSDIHAAYVFGSLARGEVGPHSDLDILIVRDTNAPRASRADDLLVERRNGIPIDFVVLRPDEMTGLDQRSGFGRTLIQEARCVYAA